MDFIAVLSQPGGRTPINSEMVQNLLDRFDQLPVFITLMLLMGIDVLTGLLAAKIDQGITSAASWIGMMRKACTILMVAFAAVLENFGTGGIPVTKMLSSLFVITESISIVENANRCGLPIPQGLIDMLQNAKAMAIKPTTTQVTINQHVTTPDVKDQKQADKRANRPDSVIIDTKSGGVTINPPGPPT